MSLYRAVANGPVGPAMAGPIIEPVIFFLIIIFLLLLFVFSAGPIIEPVIFIFAFFVNTVAINDFRQFLSGVLLPVTVENEAIVN